MIEFLNDIDYATVGGWLASAGVVGAIALVLVQKVKTSGELQIEQIRRQTTLDEAEIASRIESSEMSLKLATFTDGRASAWFEELQTETKKRKIAEEELDQLKVEFREMQEALALLREILCAKSVEERKYAESRARLFLKRMDRKYGHKRSE